VINEPPFPPPHPSPARGEGGAEERRLRRLRWRCRRGLLELDLLLRDILERRYGLLTPSEQAAFEKMLELPDIPLLACLQGQHEPPEIELRQLVRKIRQ
jgi:antitoxin CptB